MNQRMQNPRDTGGRVLGGVLLLGLLMGGLWTSGGVVSSVAATSSITISAETHFGDGSYPSGLVYGPQDAVWLTLAKSNEIGSFTAPSNITGTVALPTSAAYPYDLTIGADKNLWFSEQTGNQIGQYDLQGGFAEYPLPNPGVYPSQVILGQDGGVWFSEMEGNKIGRISPDGEMIEYALPNPASRPLGIAVDLEGNIWFTEWSGYRIGKLTPQGVLSEYPISSPTSRPSEIILGPDGNLWFINNSGRKILQIDQPSGSMTSYTLATTSTSLLDIATGPDGKIWFLGVQSIGNFDIPQGGPANLAEIAVPPFDFQGQGRSQLIAGPGSQMYFTRMDSQVVFAATTGTSDLRDLQIFINYMPDFLLEAGEFTLSAEVQNWSENPATDVVIDLTLDSFIHFVDIDAPGVTCERTGGHVLCNLPNLGGGESFPFTFTLQTTRFEGDETQWLLSLETRSAQDDYLPANNRQFRFVNVYNTFEYFNDFSNGSDQHWSNNSVDNPFGSLVYLGPFHNQGVTLRFENLPPHDRVDLCFDLYILGPWDGSNLTDPSDHNNPPLVIGPDLWSLYLDQTQIAVTSFSNDLQLKQSFPGNYPDDLYPAQRGAQAVGLFDRDHSYLDTRYHLCYPEQHTSSNLLFTFKGLFLDELGMESWALDNVDLNIYNMAIDNSLYFLPFIAR